MSQTISGQRRLRLRMVRKSVARAAIANENRAQAKAREARASGNAFVMSMQNLFEAVECAGPSATVADLRAGDAYLNVRKEAMVCFELWKSEGLIDEVTR